MPEPLNADKLYLRRTHPREQVEVVIYRNGEETIVRINEDMLRGLCRDANAFYFTGIIKAPWDEN